MATLASRPDLVPVRADLEEARESLAYWQERAQRLPRHAVRRRREARELAARWEVRVAEAEREAYGRGLLGALALLIAERRLPQPARSSAQRVALRARQAAAVVVALVVLAVAAGAAAVLEVALELLRAIS